MFVLTAVIGKIPMFYSASHLTLLESRWRLDTIIPEYQMESLWSIIIFFQFFSFWSLHTGSCSATSCRCCNSDSEC